MGRCLARDLVRVNAWLGMQEVRTGIGTVIEQSVKISVRHISSSTHLHVRLPSLKPSSKQGQQDRPTLDATVILMRLPRLRGFEFNLLIARTRVRETGDRPGS